MEDIKNRFERMKSRRERLKRIKDDPNTLDVICAHLASNGTLIDLCEMWDVPFGDVMNWIHEDEDREERWFQAQADRDEWVRHKLKDEIYSIATIDIRRCYDNEGNLLNIKDMPDDVAKALSAIDVDVSVVGKGRDSEQVVTKKIKMYDKLKAIDTYGKQLGLFVNKIEHTGNVKFEDLVGSSMPEHLRPDTPSKDDDSKE